MYSSLRQYRPNSYPVPWGYPSGPLTIEAAPNTLGDITAAQLAPTLPSGLSTFSSGVLASPWLYVGAALLAWYLYSRMSAGTTATGKPRRRRRGKKITPLTAAIYAAGGAAGGYMLGKYSGL